MISLSQKYFVRSIHFYFESVSILVCMYRFGFSTLFDLSDDRCYKETGNTVYSHEKLICCTNYKHTFDTTSSVYQCGKTKKFYMKLTVLNINISTPVKISAQFGIQVNFDVNPFTRRCTRIKCYAQSTLCCCAQFLMHFIKIVLAFAFHIFLFMNYTRYMCAI